MLLHNIRYEGHPPLWYLCLHLLSRFTDHPLAMQFLHLGVATAVLYVVTRFAPLTALQKVLFAFGYFPFFEYATISRNYALGVLLTFVVCAAWVTRPRRYLALAVLLVLLGQTSLHGLIMAIALAIASALDAGVAARSGGRRPVPRGVLVAALVVVLVGIRGTVAQLVPPADTAYAVWQTDLDTPRLAETIQSVWRGYVPIPVPTFHFWSTNVLDILDRGAPYVQAALSLPLILLSVLLVARRPAAVSLWLCGAGGMMLFAYVKYTGPSVSMATCLSCWWPRAGSRRGLGLGT